MLRCCRSTIRVVDGRVSRQTAGIRQLALTPRGVLASPPTSVHDATCRIALSSRTEGRLARPTRVTQHAQSTQPVTLLVETQHSRCSEPCTSLVLSFAEDQVSLQPKLTEGLSSKALKPRDIEPLAISASGLYTPAVRLDSKYKQLGALAKFLSATGASLRHTKMSARSLMELYYSVLRHKQLHLLDQYQLTELLSLIGILCSHYSRAVVNSSFSSRLLSCVEPWSTPLGKWADVLEIADWKKELGHELCDTDRYWIMRAHLGDLRQTDKLEGSLPAHKWSRRLSKAAAQYEVIGCNTCDPEVHIPYFDALLARPTLRNLGVLLGHLCDVLESSHEPPVSLVEVLWRILLQHGDRFSPTLRDRVLKMIFSRAYRPSYRVLQEPPVAGKSSVDGCPPYNTRRSALRIFDLSSALAAAIFPCYSVNSAPSFLRRWGKKVARAIFTPNAEAEDRWRNLLLLAMHQMPKVLTRSLNSLSSSLDETVADWQRTLILSTLENTLSDPRPHPLSVISNSQGISRILWRVWKNSSSETYPIDISRIVVASFLRIATKTIDEPLAEGCFRYCIRQSLWNYRDHSTDAMKRQAQDLIASYVMAFIAYRGEQWKDVYAMLAQAGIQRIPDVLEAVLFHYISTDFDIAYRLYQYCQRAGITLPSEAILAMYVKLAYARRWSVVIPCMSDVRFSQDQREHLLIAVLRTFQVGRQERCSPALAITIGRTISELYTNSIPCTNSKYAVRYFLVAMASSQNAIQAVNIAETIFGLQPSFFSMRYILWFLRTLIKHQQPRLASRLFRVACVHHSSSPSAIHVRRRIMQEMTKIGAHNLAKKIYHARISCGPRRSIRESLAKIVGFRIRSPTRKASLHVTSYLGRTSHDDATVRLAITLLINARRPLAARKLYERHLQKLDVKARTSIGNIILHGALHRLDQRNGRLVRHIVRTKDFLERKYAFIPDRTTLNIVLKAVLKWRTAVGSTHLRVLFDHMVRKGYPASERWRRKLNVPFGTSPSSHSQALKISSLPAYISFKRHVRPMYKMFIKAFHLVGDIQAAKTVLGILKEASLVDLHQTQKRNHARRAGILKQKRKIAVIEASP